MLLPLLILVVAVITLYLILTRGGRTSEATRELRQQSGTTTNPNFLAGNYRLWIEGTKNGVVGRYYLATYGLSQKAAAELNAKLAAAGAAANPPVPAISLPQLTPVGVGLFVFRREGDYSNKLNLYPENYLLPLGNEPNSAADDVFRLESTGTTLTIRTSDVFGQMPLSPCYLASCLQGAMVFGKDVGASPYTINTVAGGYTIALTSSASTYLNFGRSLCPVEAPVAGADAEALDRYATMMKRCSVFPSGQQGGPIAAIMTANSQALTFHLEQA